MSVKSFHSGAYSNEMTGLAEERAYYERTYAEILNQAAVSVPDRFIADRKRERVKEVQGPPTPPTSKPVPKDVAGSMNVDDLVEYIQLAGEVGVAPPDLLIEEFRAFLAKADIPVFSLAEVVAYMDDKAARESKDKCGWEWHPLREKDHRPGIAFGAEASRAGNRLTGQVITQAASDFYCGPSAEFVAALLNTENPYRIAQSPCGVYDKTVPLHALKKASKIEKAFGSKVGLFICDYALAPAIQYPDPFLMAVISNSKVASGVGRFIIDFWDEPGFGLDRMLKPA